MVNKNNIIVFLKLSFNQSVNFDKSENLIRVLDNIMLAIIVLFNLQNLLTKCLI